MVLRRHRDRTGDERRLVIIVHRPPDDHAGRAVDDQGEVNPSFPRQVCRTCHIPCVRVSSATA
jgi:hypothetical protein